MPASSSEVQELLAKLVAFDTTSAKSNLELIAFVKTYLDGYGVASTLIPSADGAKASLFAMHQAGQRRHRPLQPQRLRSGRGPNLV